MKSFIKIFMKNTLLIKCALMKTQAISNNIMEIEK